MDRAATASGRSRSMVGTRAGRVRRAVRPRPRAWPGAGRARRRPRGMGARASRARPSGRPASGVPTNCGSHRIHAEIPCNQRGRAARGDPPRLSARGRDAQGDPPRRRGDGQPGLGLLPEDFTGWPAGRTCARISSPTRGGGRVRRLLPLRPFLDAEGVTHSAAHRGASTRLPLIVRPIPGSACSMRSRRMDIPGRAPGGRRRPAGCGLVRDGTGQRFRARSHRARPVPRGCHRAFAGAGSRPGRRAQGPARLAEQVRAAERAGLVVEATPGPGRPRSSAPPSCAPTTRRCAGRRPPSATSIRRRTSRRSSPSSEAGSSSPPRSRRSWRCDRGALGWRPSLLPRRNGRCPPRRFAVQERRRPHDGPGRRAGVSAQPRRRGAPPATAWSSSSAASRTPSCPSTRTSSCSTAGIQRLS